jgi:Zn-dependent alcohol dehydrogenase
MKAAVLYKRREPMVVQDVDLPAPAAGEVSIKLGASGVCHSDYAHWSRDTWSELPMVLGHEGAGVVESVGAGVTKVKPGDHVIIAFGNKCGECFFCQRGQPYLCTPGPDAPSALRGRKLRIGADSIWQFLGVGSFAEKTVVPVGNVVTIPNEIPLAAASLVACGVSTGFGAVTKAAKVEAGASVVVIGAGGVGLNVIQSAALVGASRIIAVDLLDNKLEYARQFGATHTINGKRQDVVAEVRALTGGFGADYSFEVIGLPVTIAQAYEVVRRGGTAVVVGVATEDAEVRFSAAGLMRTAKVLMGTQAGNTEPRVDFPKIVDLYQAGKLKLDELISRRFALDEVNEAFRALHAGEVARGVIVY